MQLGTGIWNEMVFKLCVVAWKGGSPSPFLLFMWLECEHDSRGWNSHFGTRSESSVLRMAKEKIKGSCVSRPHEIRPILFILRLLYKKINVSLIYDITIPGLCYSIYVFPLKNPIFKNLACLPIKSSSYPHKHNRVLFYVLKWYLLMSIQLFFILFRYIASRICFLLEYNINLALMRKNMLITINLKY